MDSVEDRRAARDRPDPPLRRGTTGYRVMTEIEDLLAEVALQEGLFGTQDRAVLATVPEP